MQGVLVLNAVQNAAECEVKSINIHCKGYRQSLFKPLKHGSKRAKYTLKSGIFVAKSGCLGVKNNGLTTKLER